ncbi:Nucleic acid dioxygenase ALKBH1 [Seminavis robusta]|uniref:Nucleic acid dioxygenase ALKBH1 n=1 Tax=Seminavis robusta TaxID=568900 RepID=A0A9N8HX91_9STRA|nr:Nucleic acid dioxygenase ALKBH1 [Seminavis robusta]|eukprot:Sro2394_g325910.1 Nucleic acid dioxygenase ALKBH1 (405) ;mRNA; f:12583-13797
MESPSSPEAPSARVSGTASTASNEQKWSIYKRVQVQCKQAPAEEIANIPGFVDFVGNDERQDDRIIRLDKKDDENILYQGPLFGLTDYPGFAMAPQALSPALQEQLAFEAVTEYCEQPHATNIDLLPPKPSEKVNTQEESMWSIWKAEQSSSSQNNQNPHTRKRKQNQSGTPKYYRSFRKLSWATTGYHYDWTERSYHEGKKSPMPPLLQDVALLFARISLALTSTSSARIQQQFTPSASIVNYYNTKSVMGGHRDDLEYALDKPVVSISLGLPAIFLLGGKCKQSDEPVIPILVRPGDVMMLGGDARLNYHGMARVLLPQDYAIYSNGSGGQRKDFSSSGQVTRELLSSKLSQGHENGTGRSGSDREHLTEEDQKALKTFLGQHRININVRQVHRDVTTTSST